jgi:hypothetical protein
MRRRRALWVHVFVMIVGLADMALEHAEKSQLFLPVSRLFKD